MCTAQCWHRSRRKQARSLIDLTEPQLVLAGAGTALTDKAAEQASASASAAMPAQVCASYLKHKEPCRDLCSLVILRLADTAVWEHRQDLTQPIWQAAPKNERQKVSEAEEAVQAPMIVESQVRVPSICLSVTTLAKDAAAAFVQKAASLTLRNASQTKINTFSRDHMCVHSV